MMQVIEFDHIQAYDIDINNIVCVYQQWTSQCHNWNFYATPRPCHGFIYVHTGNALYYTPQEQLLTAKHGDVLYLPKGSRYLVEMAPADAISMTINFSMSYKGDDLLFSNHVCRIAKDTGNVLYEMFSDLCTLYLQTTDRFLIKSKTLNLCSELSQVKSMCESRSPIHAAIVYINQHITTITDIPAVAKMYAMSESTFRREFNRIVGCSPKKYINEQKIKKAKQMLSRGDLPISDICTSLGFFDNAYFTKVFKEHTGTTPATYRNRSAGRL